jgi:hypothetical protein
LPSKQHSSDALPLLPASWVMSCRKTIPASQPREPEAPTAKRARQGAKTKKRAEPKPRSKKLNVMQEVMTMLMPEVIQDVMPEAIQHVMQQWVEDGKPEVSMESNQ